MLAFLTVGSTRFDDLVAAAFTPRLLSALQRKGYNKLVVQCGNSSFDFATEIQNGETQTLHRAGVHIEYWKFRPSLQAEYEKADLVISHAGSGTILDVLRMGKPMIVVPNPTLADNHQEELASELESMQHLRSATVETLPQVIEEFEASEIKAFPAFERSRFRRIVDEAMGFI